MNVPMNSEELTDENQRLRTTIVSLMSEKSKLGKLNKTYRVKLARVKKEKLMNNIKLTKRNIELLTTNAKMQNKMNQMQKQLESNSTMESRMKQMQKQLDDILDVNLKCPIVSTYDYTECDNESSDDEHRHYIENDEVFIDDYEKEIIEQEICEKKKTESECDHQKEIIEQENYEKKKNESECDHQGNPKPPTSLTKSSDDVIDKTNNVVNSDEHDSEESDQPPSPKKIRRSRRIGTTKRTSVRLRSTRNKK